MGFEAKTVFVLSGAAKADRLGPNGETECMVWKDADWGLDFGHVTRLEKLVSEHFQHLRDSFHPFRRAGICVVDCFLYSCLFVDFENRIGERCAPEILVPKPFFGDERRKRPTIKVGGRTYLDVYESRLKGRMGNETLVEDHNVAVGDPGTLRELLEKGEWHPMMDPPLLWASCSELADCLDKAEAEQNEAWKAAQYDPVSDAFVRGWRESLHRLSVVGARAVFRFS